MARCGLCASMPSCCWCVQERREGGREDVTAAHQSHLPSFLPSIHSSTHPLPFLWLKQANAAAKRPPVFSAATLKVTLHIFFCYFVSRWLPSITPPPPLPPHPPHPPPLVILEYQQNRSAPVRSLTESLSPPHISAMCSPSHALCKVCASQQAICMISSFWAGRR